MILFIYLFKTIFISGLLFGYYSWFLKNRRFHTYNRYYLLSIPVISLILPMLQFKSPFSMTPLSGGTPIRLLEVGRGTLEEAVTIYAHQGFWKSVSWTATLPILCLLISLFLFFRLFKTVQYILRLRKNNTSLPFSDARIYFTNEKTAPFSFFKSIFWDRATDIESTFGKQMIQHELFHVKQQHSADILLLEIISILFWFNPFFYMIRREMKAVHEYSADAFAIQYSDAYAYASLLLMKASGSPLPLTHPFFNNQIKRRITMITKNKQMKSLLVGRLMILPLLLVLTLLFAFKIQKNESGLFATSSPIRIVIDAGHGGLFSGTTFNNIQEKNINLSISKKIQALASNYHLEVVMSREKDESPGSNQLPESLNYVANLAARNNASLFISIHTNQLKDHTTKYQDQQSGFEIFIPGATNKVHDNSVKLGSSIAEYIKPDYSIEAVLKTREKGVFILEHATVPAVLIMCGYLDNASDLKYLNDEKNQEKIAEDILKGIRNYLSQGNSEIINTSIQKDPLTEADQVSDSSGKTHTKVEIEASYPGG